MVGVKVLFVLLVILDEIIGYRNTPLLISQSQNN